MKIKTRILNLIEKLLPFTVISSPNKKADCPGYLIPIIRFQGKKKVYIIGRKIKNIHNTEIQMNINALMNEKLLYDNMCIGGTLIHKHNKNATQKIKKQKGGSL